MVSVKGKERLWYLGNVPSRRIRKQEGCKDIEKEARGRSGMVKVRLSEGVKREKGEGNLSGSGNNGGQRGSLGW